jgi:hypothetical protein
MSARDPHLEYLRLELEASQTLLRALEGEARGAQARQELRASLGVTPSIHEGRASVIRSEAYRTIQETVTRWRQLIAEHLAKTGGQTVEPIRAASDDGAIFELLAQVGGRMPEGGAR